jgi:hypothetical protein
MTTAIDGNSLSQQRINSATANRLIRTNGNSLKPWRMQRSNHGHRQPRTNERTATAFAQQPPTMTASRRKQQPYSDRTTAMANTAQAQTDIKQQPLAAATTASRREQTTLATAATNEQQQQQRTNGNSANGEQQQHKRNSDNNNSLSQQQQHKRNSNNNSIANRHQTTASHNNNTTAPQATAPQRNRTTAHSL